MTEISSLLYVKNGLKELLIPLGFNQSINGVKFPDALESLDLSESFNQNIDNVIFPHGLERLIFGSYFNQPIDYLPENLRQLYLCNENYQYPINSLPDSIEYLVYYGNNEITRLPKKLKYLCCKKKIRDSLMDIMDTSGIQIETI